MKIVGLIGKVPFEAILVSCNPNWHYSLFVFKCPYQGTYGNSLASQGCVTIEQAESDLRAFLVAIGAKVDEQMRASDVK